MSLIQGCNHFHRECLFIVLLNSFLSPQLVNKLSDQSAESLKTNLSITVYIPITICFILIYIEKDLQQIFKTILEA